MSSVSTRDVILDANSLKEALLFEMEIHRSAFTLYATKTSFCEKERHINMYNYEEILDHAIIDTSPIFIKLFNIF